MKKVSRYLALMLCALLLAAAPAWGALSEGTDEAAFAPFDEEVTLSLGRSVDPNVAFEDGNSVEDNFYTRTIKEMLNINVTYEWLCAPADYDQKVNLAIASDALPDALVVNLTQYNAMVKYDLLQDMTDVYNNYASETFKYFYESGGDAIKQVTEFDGRMMGLASPNLKASAGNHLFIRQDWLDTLGLEVPMTMDAVKDVARAFIEQDPDGNGQDDTIGIIGPQKGGRIANTGGNMYGFDAVFSSFQSYPRYWLEGEDGQVVYGSTLPETRAALEELAQMYADGLIDKEMLIRDDSLELVLSDKGGIFFAPWWAGYTISDNLNQDVPADWQAYASPVAEDGNYYVHMGSPAGNYVAVSKKCENPEAAMKIINLLIRDEAKWIAEGAYMASGMSAVYPLFSVFDGADEVEFSYQALNDLLAGSVDIETFDFTGHKLLEGDMVAIQALKKEPFDDFGIENWNLDSELKMANLPRLISIMIGGKPMTADNLVEVYSLLYAQTDTMTSRWANLEKLEEEVFAKIIMGQEGIEAFDQFVTDWHAQGGDTILQEVAAAIGK